MGKVLAGTLMGLLVVSVLSAGVLAAPVTGPTKWSQPIYQIGTDAAGTPIYWGWDQASWSIGLPPNRFQAADDWLCQNNLPVTDIHWWGSYLGSLNPNPPIVPAGFWFGIYTDIPAGPAPSYSTPGQLVWQYATTSYQQTFVGLDVLLPGTAPNDATFQYNVYLPPTDYFTQTSSNTVYWLSIVAIYNPNGPVQEWGWKSRPHFWGDDAVFSGPTGAGWQELRGPDNLSWDLSFELSTTPEPGSLVALGAGLVGLIGFGARRRRS